MMPRQPKPRLHQGWYVTEAGGLYTKLCPESDGPVVAAERLAAFLAARGTPAKPATPATTSLTVAEAVELFMEHAKVYYKLPNGKESTEVANHLLSFRELLAVAGSCSVTAVDRKVLRAARDVMIASGLSRKVINQRIGRVQRAFRWLASNDHIPDAVPAALSLLKSLQAYRSAAAETEPIQPVPGWVVRATLTKLDEPWRTMVQVQWWTGMRPGEVRTLRRSMMVSFGRHRLRVDFGREHKMAYRGRKRIVFLNQQAVMAMKHFLFLAEVRGVDVVFGSPNRGRGRSTGYGRPTDRTAYCHAIARAAESAGVPSWHPNQIRHAVATIVRETQGLDAAQAVLGHAKADVTQLYAAIAADKHERLMRKRGG